MKILIYVNTAQNLDNNSKLGGIEILNYELAKYLNKKNNVLITNKLSRKIRQTDWHTVISSNESKIFSYVKANKKILWIHNKIQIEKALRKRQIFSYFKNQPYAIFVSKFLEKQTSKLYPFKKRYIINNFLHRKFENINKVYYRKPIITWSVKRTKGLDELIASWTKSILPYNPEAKLYIFGVNKKNNKISRKNNIYYFGNVKKSTLIKYYKISTAMICLGYDETFCLNAIESMSCGQPVLSFKKTALNDLIKNNTNGFKVNNFNDLSKKIKFLLNIDLSKRKKLINKTQNYSKKFYFKNVLKKWEKIIQ